MAQKAYGTFIEFWLVGYNFQACRVQSIQLELRVILVKVNSGVHCTSIYLQLSYH